MNDFQAWDSGQGKVTFNLKVKHTQKKNRKESKKGGKQTKKLKRTRKQKQRWMFHGYFVSRKSPYSIRIQENTDQK